MNPAVRCPQCRQTLRVPAEFLGHSVNCPTCATAFVAQEETSGTTASSAPSSPGGDAPWWQETAVESKPAAAPPPKPPTAATQPASWFTDPGSLMPADNASAPAPQYAPEPPAAPRGLSPGVRIALGIAAGVGFLLLGLGGAALFLFRDRHSAPQADVRGSTRIVTGTEGTVPADVAPAATGGEAIPRATLQAIKGATVFIKVEAGPFAASGSGFVILNDGADGYVVTNEHVVTPPRTGRTAPKPVVTLTFHSGSAREQSVAGEVMAADPERDLAVLKFTGVKEPPAPIAFATTPALVETMPVYVFGFPFGKMLSTGKGNPAITVSKGTISSIRKDDFDRLALVQIDGALNPGNSGGPVVDAQGHLVGVAVATIRGANNLGMAIPPDELRDLLSGRVIAAGIYSPRPKAGGTELAGEIWVFNPLNGMQRVVPHAMPAPEGLSPAGEAKAQVHVEAVLIDPLRKVRSVHVQYVPAELVARPPKAEADGRWAPLVGTQKSDLALVDNKAKATLSIPAAMPTDYYFQFSFAGPDGKPAFTQPRIFRVARPGQDATDPKEPVATTLPAGWKAYTPPDSSFTVWLPEGLGKKSDRTRSTKQGQLQFNFSTVIVESKDGTVYDAGSILIDPPTASNRIPVLARIELMRDMFVDGAGGKLVEQKDVKQGRVLGREYLIEAAASMVRVRIWASAGRIYVASVSGPRKQVESKDTATFLESYKLPERITTATGDNDPPRKEDAPDPRKELKRFEGKWQKVRQEIEGREAPDVSKHAMIVDGTEVAFLYGGTVNSKARIVIDPTKQPRLIDVAWTLGPGSGKTSFGIYRFTDDGQLEICLNPASTKDTDRRPTQFTTKPGTGNGSILYVFRAEKK